MRLAVCCLAVLIITASLQAADPLDIAVWTKQGETVRSSEGRLTVMIRRYETSTLIQMDVFEDSSAAVTFVTGWGVSNRAICEAVYVDKDAWFAICDVYEAPFASPREFFRTFKTNRRLARYFLSAQQRLCEPRRCSDADPEDIGLQAAFEMSAWSAAQRNGFFSGFRILGAHGAPRLGERMALFWDLDVRGEIDDGEITPLEAEPVDLMVMLDIERQGGLGDWLDGLANTLP